MKHPVHDFEECVEEGLPVILHDHAPPLRRGLSQHCWLEHVIGWDVHCCQ